MARIDAHLHVAADHPDSLALLAEYDLRLVNISVAGRPGWRRQADLWRALAEEHPERFVWITSFDLPTFDEKDYAERVIAQLDEDLSHPGCHGVKVWKNVGMELRRPDGGYVQIDDPIFEPILAHLERRQVPLVMHLGEPLACWRPLTDDNPHAGYYRAHPEWHMHGRDDVPHHRDIMAARDRLLARHPRLPCIGAHFGSLEWDVDELARRFEAYPNFAADTSARLQDAMIQDPAKVRAFAERYADRLLWGTDIVQGTRHTQLGAAAREGAQAYHRLCLEAELGYWTTAGPVTWRDREFAGLALSPRAQDELFAGSARRWLALAE